MPKKRQRRKIKGKGVIGPWYSLVAQVVDGLNIVSLNIFGEIGWEVTAKEFIDDLNALGEVDRIEVEIGSPGGSVWDGLAIYNALLAHKATISVLITSLAASMASVIAQAASAGELRMMASSMQMLHNPATSAWGDQHDLEKAAEVLAKIRETMVGAYMRRYDGTDEEMIALLDDETWFTAEDCVANGLADEVVEQEMDIAACLKDVDLTMFADVPKEFLALIAGGLPPGGQGENGDEEEATERAKLVSEIISRHKKQSAAADEDSQTEDEEMTPEEIAAAEKAARVAEAKRQSEIRAAFSKFDFEGSTALLQTCIDNLDCTAESASAQLLTALGGEATPIAGGTAIVLEDARDKFRIGAEAAILMRMNVVEVDHKNEFASMSIMEMIKANAAMRGVSLSGMDRHNIVAVGLQPGSDFPGILENIATKEVLRGYDETPEVYPTLARIGNLPDFKSSSRAGLGHAPSLVANAELQEIETLEIGDRKQAIQLATYAGRFGLSRVAIINDDLNEFGRMMSRIGRAARRTVGDRFSLAFTTAAGLGQTLDEDSVAVFDAAHSNIGASGGAPTTARFDDIRVKMRTQSDVSGVANLNIVPRYIYCPVALEGASNVVATSEFDVGASTKNNTIPNTERGRWTVVSDPRLDTASAVRYYGLGDPNVYDTLEVAFLDGRDEPSIQRVDQLDPLGVYWVSWIDCVAQWLDYRAAVTNAGA